MNKSLVITTWIVALIGLAINVGVDRDNIYDMTLAGLWTLTLVLAFAGAFLGGKMAKTSALRSTSALNEQRQR